MKNCELSPCHTNTFDPEEIKPIIMATIKNGVLFLRAGRQIPIYNGILIIRPSLELTTVWTGDLLVKNKTEVSESKISPVSNPYNLTEDDFYEIADYMMQLWMKLKNNIRNKGLESIEIFKDID